MKRGGVAVAVLFLFFGAVYLINYQVSYSPKGNTQIIGKGKDDTVVDIFLINDVVYYVNEGGELYLIDTLGKEAYVEMFSTNSVCWSGESGGFLYLCDDGNIVCYDPISKIERIILNLNDKGVSTSNLDYIICAWRAFVYCKIGRDVYKINILGGDIDGTSRLIQNWISISERGIICQSDDYKTLVLFDPVSSEQQTLLVEESDKPIVTACVVDDIVFYVRSDGKIKQCKMKEDADDSCYKEMIETMEREYILGIAKSGENLLCVVEEQIGNNSVITVFLVLQNGTKEILSRTNEPCYSVPGSCIVKANESVFAYGVTTDEVVISGTVCREGAV